MNMTKKIKQLEARLSEIEGVHLRLIDFLAKATDFAAASRENEMKLLAITNQAAANHAALREKCEQMHDTFTAAVRAADYSPHTNH